MVEVAEEHQKKGIGKFLSKLWRKAFPFKGSGGFSDQGLSTFKRVHQDFVREALESGEYDKAVKEGWMSPKRFMDILDSAGLDPEGNETGKPRIDKPDLSGSPELRKLRKELSESGALMREMNREEGEYSDEAVEEHRKKHKALLNRALRMEEEERDQAQAQKEERDQRMSELASKYWAAKSRGDAEEAQRIWDEMGAA